MRARSAAVYSALAAAVGRDEIGVGLALALIAVGMWQAWRPGAFLVPGVVLLWIVLPVRHGFIARHAEPVKPVPRRTS